MLLTNFPLGQLTLKNRVVMPPMCMYSAKEDGQVTDWHVQHYTTRATGQVGLIIVEATAVEERGRISDKDLGIWEDGHIEGLKRLTDSVHAAGGKIALQLAHAGRKSEAAATIPAAPSAVAFSDQHKLPHALTTEEIKAVVEKFQAAAVRAVKAGFDTVEIHAAHGYLINEFLSPLTNLREDEYGGVPANRVRFLKEVLIAVKAVLPAQMPVLVRVSAEEYQTGGNTPEIVAEMLNMVKEYGIDAVNVSSGGVLPLMPRAFASYQIPMALLVKERTGLAVLGGGLVTDAAQAQQIVKAGVDLVYTGRLLLRQPYWVLQAAHELNVEIDWPAPYLRGKWL